MIGLNTGIFKPLVILFSVVVLPITIAIFVYSVVESETMPLIVSVIMFLFYNIAIYLFSKFSKSNKYYMYKQDGFIIINYPNLTKGPQLRVNISSITKIEYYKISSFKSWCLLYSNILPQCVFITYLEDGIETCKLIGYPDFVFIRNMCNDLGITIVVK